MKNLLRSGIKIHQTDPERSSRQVDPAETSLTSTFSDHLACLEKMIIKFSRKALLAACILSFCNSGTHLG